MFLQMGLNRILSWLYTFLISIGCQRVKIGRGSIVFFRSSIVNASKLGGALIGTDCRIGCPSKMYHGGLPFYTKILITGNDGFVKIGNNTRINGANIHAEKKIEIGNRCVIASGVHIMDSNGHEVSSLDRTIGRDEPKEIIIGNNVWIGVNAIILKGTVIGDNSIVSAGSVVKGEFPGNVIIEGNPAGIARNLDL